MRRKSKLLALLFFLVPVLCQATTFTEDGSIDEGVYGNVRIINRATVDMTGGSVDKVNIEQMGTLNYYGGTIIREIRIWNSGTFNLEGANLSPVRPLRITDAGVFNLNSGTLSGRVELREYVEVNVNGGQIINSRLDSRDYSVTNIYSGIHTFEDFGLYGFSTFNIYGGQVNWLNAGFNNNSIINIYGGSIHSEHGFDVESSSQFNVYYTSIIYSDDKYPIVIGYHLLDGNKFMLDAFTTYEINQMNFQHIPEPSFKAAIDIDPDTINTKSQGKWITCDINNVPDGYGVADIVEESIKLGGVVVASGNTVDGETLTVKFDRQAVIEALAEQEGVDLNGGFAIFADVKVTGEFTDGKMFEGTDKIRFIHNAKPTTIHHRRRK